VRLPDTQVSVGSIPTRSIPFDREYMLAFLGDIHGDVCRLERAERRARGYATALIQVGDFGFDDATLAWLEHQPFEVPVYLIDGNHEDHALLPLRASGAQLLGERAYFVPRGEVIHLDGRRVGFLGGADSVDKHLRLQRGLHWSAAEEVAEADCVKLAIAAATDPLDLLVTHGPPQELIERHFDRMDLRNFGLHPSWTSASALRLDDLWATLSRPYLLCGHMHRAVAGDNYRMLAVNELVYK
jgi:predicted phosphodiesterase